MSDIEYSVITSDVIKSFDCITFSVYRCIYSSVDSFHILTVQEQEQGFKRKKNTA